MSLLTVNLNYVAALRGLSGAKEPDPAQAAVLAELAGADGISVLLQRDRSQVRERDMYLLKGVSKTRLTVAIAPVDELIDRVLEVKPWMVVLVADQAGGEGRVSTIDFAQAPVDYSEISARFTGAGLSVAYLVAPDIEEIRGASKADASAVMIDCSGYTMARTLEDAQSELDRIDVAVQSAVKSNLSVHCARGIDYKNVRPLVELGVIDDFTVGGAICGRAMLVGMERAVHEMNTLLHLEQPPQ
ncbi:MAG: pyridoxine 5'-phosphate synthase [Candidatus Zixiibacteriota bacterium]